MNTQNMLIATLLILAFVLCIIPTSSTGKKILTIKEAKRRRDLAKWRRRQKVLDQIEQRQRLSQ